MPVDHYENFPVASFLITRPLQHAIHCIYAFARNADDIADEGDATVPERLAQLATYEYQLQLIAQQKKPTSVLFEKLSQVVQQFQLPLSPFFDLLQAFKQDLSVNRYATFEQLIDYCAHSANPVGLLMLQLHGKVTEQNIIWSNAICSALQLINFWQDVTIDAQKKRIYIPQEDLLRFGIDEERILHAPILDAAWRELMHFQIVRTRELMQQGAPLAQALTGRFAWELRLIMAGGLCILEKIEQNGYDVFKQRLQLRKYDWLRLTCRLIFKKIRP